MSEMRRRVISISALLITATILGLWSTTQFTLVAQSDPIPTYLNQVSLTNLTTVATDLVTLYGPRREDTFSPYIDDQCTPSTTIVYPKSTIEMSADYVKELFAAMGYAPSAITMELVPQGAGHNVYVTKVGSTYPNVYIEFSAHMDSVAGSPGGNDNASGSTAVIELARVLKDYPNRYSMRFILWVGEEFSGHRGVAYFGSAYHVQQALARGEQIKAGLVMDHIGWPNPADPTGLMNGVSYNNAESERIADMFDQVRTEYGIDIGFDKVNQIFNSDEHSYWDLGQTAISSGGGWLYYRPHYHGCGDTVENISFTNVLRTAQQNLAVGIKLDQEVIGTPGTPSATPVPPTATTTPNVLTPTTTPLPPTATSTPGPATGFPSTTVLDTFNRANGALGNNWGGATTGYTIAANRLDVGAGDAILWSATAFGADQEVFVTYNTVDGAGVEHDLLLKSQSSSTALDGVLEVWYDPANQRAQVWTYSPTQNWVQRGADIPVTLANGDQFGARANADGSVEVYRNGLLIGTRNASGWTFATSGGYIGLWHINAYNALLDDFGGGSVSGGATMTPTHTPVAPTATATLVPPTATATSVPPTATDTSIAPTATNTSLPPTPTSTPVPPTATNTPLPPTPTSTPVAPTATNTPLPPTATSTPGPATGFPSTTVLDTFNRANGALGNNWGGATTGYTIAANRLDVGAGDAILWSATAFGADQEVFVTYNTVDGAGVEHDLLLKSQSSSTALDGVLEVWYDPTNQRAQVWTYSPTQNWVQRGADIPVTLANGDQFGARANADGSVEVYRNGLLIGTRNASGWTFATSGGYIGLWHINAYNALLDDFGGGSVSGGATAATAGNVNVADNSSSPSKPSDSDTLTIDLHSRAEKQARKSHRILLPLIIQAESVAE